jgi:hypothetical protein
LFGASEECHTIINLRKVIPYSHTTRTATRKIGQFSARIDRLIQKAWRRDATKSFADTIYIWRDYGFNRAVYTRPVGDREVGGSNPLAPIFRINNLRASRDARFAFAVTFAATLGLEEHRVLFVNFQTRLPTSKVARCHEILLNIPPIASIAVVSGFDL